MTTASDFTQNIVRQQMSIDAAGLVAALVRNNGTLERSLADFAIVNPDGRRRLGLLTLQTLQTLQTRAAVAPGTTTDSAWAAPLAHGTPVTDAIVEAARAASVLARMP